MAPIYSKYKLICRIRKQTWLYTPKALLQVGTNIGSSGIVMKNRPLSEVLFS
jgi:hypothetical protein